ncbi:tRNA (adenosine(37)-N6)-threonylcarbamoyltransferase complex dimerization subunit type 1 TsaB [Aureimonas ureilytica]|uniref:tRNA (adenosine(37)-N6)-threonylcarbamoyltransferase complex dimerization subunit type 1 TsaB n=1 Tax=Aureimonas ureilytica TaxID=401562 RepID=UPI000376EE9E|nr:tRNA (adenosine(37)-N6)-threonylcarbamoyltransferase complex dimerization subunit type 1 TsaB [Aureimonas ureilytica]
MADLLLAIDTANERCSAALYSLREERLLALHEEEIGRGHAERLMGVIADVLAEAGAPWRAIAKLGVCIGPGSFTGIRVGVACVRGLELSLKVPAVGISSLEALAAPDWTEGPVLAVHDAKRGEVYAALFAQGGETLWEPQALAPSDLSGFVAQAGAGLRVVGTGVEIAREVLGDGAALFRPETRLVSIEALARLAAGRAPAGPPLPLYLRGADAKAQVPLGLRAAAH